MVGSDCRVKQFTTGSRNSLKEEEVETEVWNWLRLVCCGFRRTGKATGQVHQCWCICRVGNVYSRFEHHMFYVSRPFVTYLLTPS
jgi:hypothetical protein